MDVNYINPMLHSVTNVLSTMATMEVTPGNISIKKVREAMGDVSAIIMMHGDKFSGSMTISFKREVIFDVARRMLGKSFNKIDKHITDLVCEIANLACAGTKAEFAKNGINIGLATPVVVTGDNHLITHQIQGPRILLPLKVDSGYIYVEMCFDQVKHHF